MLLRYFYCFCLFVAGVCLASASVSPQNVVVVANENDKASVALAKFYLEKRNIPEANLVLVKAPAKEIITWDEFVGTILNPLRAQLVQSGWISASLPGGEDVFGRTEIVPRRHRIDFMVLCRMPLRISRDEQRLGLEPETPNTPALMRTNTASLDSELSLIVMPRTPLAGPLPNPLMGKDPTPALVYGPVVRVARLDGIPGTAERSVENGLLAEQIGLRGIAYIDLSLRHPSGDEWLQKTGELLASQYYPVITEPTKRLMNWQDRIDGAAFYFGWYSANPQGPMLEEDFRFSAGALGLHIYSFTATTLRAPRAWTPRLIRAGITGTVGNVSEPFLHLTHRPDLFVEGLLKGMSAGEAAYYALPALSWMCLYAGDPLYQPFKVDLDAQLAQIEADPASPDAQYVVLRQAQRLRAQSGAAASLRYLEASAQKVQGLALSYALARELANDTQERRAFAALAPFMEATQFSNVQMPLAYRASELLVELSRRQEALTLLAKLLASEKLHDDAVLTYGGAALPLARQFGQSELADGWEARIAQIHEKRAEEARKREEARLAREAAQKAKEAEQKAGAK